MRPPAAVFDDLRQPGERNSLSLQDDRVFAVSTNGPGPEASKQGGRFKTKDIACDHGER